MTQLEVALESQSPLDERVVLPNQAVEVVVVQLSALEPRCASLRPADYDRSIDGARLEIGVGRIAERKQVQPDAGGPAG